MNNKNNHKECLATEQQYVAPHIEVIDIEISQGILNSSVGDFDDGGNFNP